MESISATHPQTNVPNFEPLVSQGTSLIPLSGSPIQFSDDLHPYEASSRNTYLKDFIGLNVSRSPLSNDKIEPRQDSKKDLGFTNFRSRALAASMDDQEIVHQPSTFLKLGPEPERLNFLNTVSCVTNVEHERHNENNNNLLAEGSIGHKVPQGNINKGPWSHEEDRSLIQLVKEHGSKKWTEIARKLSGRVGKQCRDRWENHLRPDIKKGGWSQEEEMQLIELHRQLGSKWCEIARRMPSRSENTIKNHWYATKRKRNSSKMNRTNNLLHTYITSVGSTSASHEHPTHFDGVSCSNDSRPEELENIPRPLLDINAIPEGDPDDGPYVPGGLVVDHEGNLEVEYQDQDQDPSHHSSTSSVFDEKKEMDFFEMLVDQDFH